MTKTFVKGFSRGFILIAEHLNHSLLARQINSRISELLIDRDGVHSQTQNCVANILLTLLKLSTNSNRDERHVDRCGLEEHLEAATQVTHKQS